MCVCVLLSQCHCHCSASRRQYYAIRVGARTAVMVIHTDPANRIRKIAATIVEQHLKASLGVAALCSIVRDDQIEGHVVWDHSSDQP